MMIWAICIKWRHTIICCYPCKKALIHFFSFFFLFRPENTGSQTSRVWKKSDYLLIQEEEEKHLPANLPFIVPYRSWKKEEFSNSRLKKGKPNSCVLFYFDSRREPLEKRRRGLITDIKGARSREFSWRLDFQEREEKKSCWTCEKWQYKKSREENRRAKT